MLAGLVALGARIYIAAAFAGIVGLIWLRGWDIGTSIAGVVPHSATGHFTLSVLPMFILIGFLAHAAGLTDAAFRAAKAWVGHLPGGLGIATVFAAAAFAAVSGATTATSAVFARTALPEMLKAGYSPRISAGVVASAGTLSALIPPSAILVIYAIIVEQSVGRLLLAGFIPGVLTALLYAGVIIVFSLKDKNTIARQEKASWNTRISTLTQTTGIMIVAVIILGGIYSGIATPTEVGALGVFTVLIVSLIQKRMTFTVLKSSLLQAASLTIMIFSIIWAVMIFVRFLGFSGLPNAFSSFVVDLPVPPLVILLCIFGLYIIMGMFMDAIGMLLLTLPVIFPAVVALGYDPIWFGIILVKLVEIGLVTPPIGLNCFVVKGAYPDIAIEDVFRGIWPFVIADLLLVAVLVAQPEIVTFLPNAILN
ncbi:tripartite ATP-independent transporter DctM subunit [Roseovarius halotolerans]|uniref:TRAP transporter large permease protein n=2 Tax=Roseovarius halotolerans TaxID=505353 RepID=A0A1X6ZYR2_9RHOB|nr:tripartite ATP-independent transporter DctM subunit [Roseovarius halotolerans]SLN64934.1 Sialic acid TRAP transporter permease protein SiaT [Roseovarius halotolerans]